MAHIGLTEEEAMKRGYPIKISRLPASAIPRARTLQNMDGMLKAIVNTDTEKILGYQSSSICHENRTEIFGFT